MAIEQHQQQPVQPAPTVTLTKAQLEQQLWWAYRKGCAHGLKQVPPAEVVTPTCPVHPKVPLWVEAHPTADGSWLYCPFCRQDALKRDTGALRMKHLQPQTYRPSGQSLHRYSAENRHKTRLVSPNDDFLNAPSTDVFSESIEETETQLLTVPPELKGKIE